MKVVISDCSWNAYDVEKRALPADAEVVCAQVRSEQDILDICKDADAVLSEYGPYTRKVLEQLPKLKIISNSAMGVDNIDLAAAKDLGIAVANVPDYCFDEVAEHAMALILAAYLRSDNANADRLDAQEWLYPDNYVKLRFLENHDRARAAHILPEETVRRNWTAFNYFQRGLTLVYAGQEVDDPHVPSLFDKDPVHWQTGRDQSDFLTRLAAIKRDPIFAEGSYTLTALPHDVLLAVYEQNGRRVAGLFSLRGASALVRFPAPNGVYHDSITGRPVEIYENQLATDGQPLILEL